MDTVTRKSDFVTVHNVLASATLACPEKIDLDKCSMIFGNSYYNPEEFPALRIDIRGSNSSVYTISIFESGRIQSTGSCRSREVKRAMLKIGRRLSSKLSYKITFCNFEIQNILAVYDSCYSISLNSFVSKFQGAVDYEPDRFPAARVRIVIPPVPSTKKESSSTESPSQDVLSSSDFSNEDNVPASIKIRRLLMGELEEKSNTSMGSDRAAAVGSYMITSGAKRSQVQYRLKKEKHAKEECVTANVFSTGKITFTGAKSIRSLKYALDKLKPGLDPERLYSPFQETFAEHPLFCALPYKSHTPNVSEQSQCSELEKLNFTAAEAFEKDLQGRIKQLQEEQQFLDDVKQSSELSLMNGPQNITKPMQLICSGANTHLMPTFHPICPNGRHNP